MPTLKKIGVIVLRISISLLLLVFLFNQIKPGSLLEIIKGAEKPLLFLSFLVTFLGYYFCYLRWKMLLETSGIFLSRKRLVSAFSGGIFFNTFLPSTIGGDFVRSADIGYHSKKTSTAVATVLLDRLSGFTGMMIVALSALILGAGSIKDNIVIVSVWILSGILLAVLLLTFNDHLSRMLVNLLRLRRPGGKIRAGFLSVLLQMRDFKRHKPVILKNLLFSVVIQMVGPVTTCMIAYSFHLQVNMLYFFLFVPIISAITLLPISIGGLGVRDYATILLFAGVGISKHSAFAISLLGFVFILVYAGIGGLIYVLTLHHRRV